MPFLNQKNLSHDTTSESLATEWQPRKRSTSAKEIRDKNHENHSKKCQSSNQHHIYSGPQSLSVPHHQGPHPSRGPRSQLLPYITNPDLHQARVIHNTANTVLIKDKYPKAKVHFLLLPKWQPHRDLHPHDAFADADFLEMMRAEVRSAMPIAASYLDAHVKESPPHSESSLVQSSDTSSGLDYETCFQVGIHAHPSQSHLHVHIISRDMVSDSLRDFPHYSSFNTPFFIPLSVYPLAVNDVRRDVRFQNKNLLRDDCRCWRCGKRFGVHFPRLKEHLEEEWTDWKKELQMTQLTK